MAVAVKGGYKRYGDGDFVLNNLNMNVGVGEIYGLLGASGCGKTTLLSCLVGLRQLDSGQVTIFNQPRPSNLGRICGFMPQDMALLEILTVAEVLKYFGILFGMGANEFKSRLNFLTNFLDIKQIHTPIIELSGGQKRRVSLAAAMLHNPRLLVLDEPIVGLDPLLRQKIWNYLLEISRDCGTTIIISTHYLEEIKSCDKIGLMRNGQLIGQDNPHTLLASHNATSLNEVVLELCKNNELTKNANINSPKYKVVKEEAFFESKHFISTSQSSSPPLNVQRNHISIIWALIYKWIHRHRRDFRLHIWQLLLPISCVYTFQNVMGPEPKRIKFGLAHHDDFNFTDTFAIREYCGMNSTFQSASPACFSNIEICHFLSLFDEDEFIWILANSYNDGLDQIKQGRTMGLVYFPPDYTTNLQNRLSHRNFADNKTTLGSTISVRMDEANMLLTFWAKKNILDKYLVYMDGILAACDYQGNAFRPRLHFHTIYGSAQVFDYIDFMQPGLTIMMMTVMSISVALLWVQDRVAGLEQRDHVAGVLLWHRLFADSATQSVIILIQIGIFLAVLCGWYGMVIHGSWVVTVGLLYMASLCAVLMGFMISLLLDNIIETMFMTIMVTYFEMYSNGVLWPMEMAAWPLRQLYQLSPLTLMVDAIRSLCTRGWDITHPVVAVGFAPAVGWILVSLVVCVLADRRRYK